MHTRPAGWGPAAPGGDRAVPGVPGRPGRARIADGFGYSRRPPAHGDGRIDRVSTDTLIRPDTTTDESTDNDTPKYFHYVKKDKIAESAVMGTHVVALCGEVFPVTRSAKPGSPVCPECKRIYEMMKKD